MSKKEAPKEKDWGKVARKAEEEIEDIDLDEQAEQADADHELGFHDLKEQLAEAEATANKHLEDFLRIQAELQNARKRAERDIQNAHKFGNEKLITELVSTIDNLERGLDACGDENESVREGIEMTLKGLLGTLKKFGLDVVDPKQGDAFDAHVHEAVTTEPSDDVASNGVLKVLQKGYQLNGRLLRPAMVIVAAS